MLDNYCHSFYLALVIGAETGYRRVSVSAFNDFRTGFAKPLYDLMLTLLFYTLSIVVMSTKSVLSNFHNTSGLNDFAIADPLLFLTIAIIVSFLSEIILGFKQGIYYPLNACMKVLGIILGIAMFWGTFVAVASIIGNSPVEMIVSLILVCLSSIAGVIVRGMIIESANRDHYYDY